MSAVVELFANTLGQFIPAELVCFIISMIPVLELRGGLLAASILGVTYWKAVIVCVIGNIVPIPFILLFIKQILKLMKKVKGLGKFAIWLENKAQKKSSALKKGEFLGLMLFVGIPLPGTGAWSGSLVASILQFKYKDALLSILLGIILAAIIMTIGCYGTIGLFKLFI